LLIYSKQENLLLDRNRNIIITDFGFANQFDSSSRDLMSTSCGSPCYAAPELVISDGLYVGSGVDIWSCGVILVRVLCILFEANELLDKNYIS
jgi:protein-serine/threonine kinase